MSVAAANTHSTKIGTCPHGMPLGACPICSGMAGGNSTTKRDIPRNVGEMTYNQCAAIGAMLKAQKAAQQRNKISHQNYIQSLHQFQKVLDNIHQKILTLSLSIQSAMPAIIHTPVNFILTQLVRTISIIAKIPDAVVGMFQKIVEISDKLAAVFGELKSAISNALSNLLKQTKKKLKSIFFIFGADDTDNEDRIEEVKKTFSLKTFIHRLTQKLKNDKERIPENE